MKGMNDESPTDKEKIRTYKRYDNGEIDEKETRAIFGDDLDRMESDITEFEGVTKSTNSTSSD